MRPSEQCEQGAGNSSSHVEAERPGLEAGSLEAFCPIAIGCAGAREQSCAGEATWKHATTLSRTYGLWPMMRPGEVSGATRALKCLWHEVRVGERTRTYVKRDVHARRSYIHTQSYSWLRRT
eukprot:3532266-Prymnesium_polylepis.1